MRLEQKVIKFSIVYIMALLVTGTVITVAAPPNPPESDVVKLRIRGFRNVRITRVNFQSVAVYDMPGTGHDIKGVFRLPKTVRENQRFTLLLTMKDGDRLEIPAQLKKTYSKKNSMVQAGGGMYSPWVMVKFIPDGSKYIWDVQVWGLR